MKGISFSCSSVTATWKRSRNCLSDSLAHLLRLVGDHLAFASLAHAVALYGLGQNERRLSLVIVGGLVGGINLCRVVTAARQLPDLLVRPVGNEGRRLRVACRRTSRAYRRHSST